MSRRAIVSLSVLILSVLIGGVAVAAQKKPTPPSAALPVTIVLHGDYAFPAPNPLPAAQQYTVPSGQRLTIQSIAGSISWIPSGRDAALQLNVSRPSMEPVTLPVPVENNFSYSCDGDFLFKSAQFATTVYVDPGQTISLNIVGDLPGYPAPPACGTFSPAAVPTADIVITGTLTSS